MINLPRLSCGRMGCNKNENERVIDPHPHRLLEYIITIPPPPTTTTIDPTFLQ